MPKTSTHFRVSFISLIKASILSVLLMSAISCSSSSDDSKEETGGTTGEVSGTPEAASLPEALTKFKSATSELGLTE
jgi:hypothetical protein